MEKKLCGKECFKTRVEKKVSSPELILSEVSWHTLILTLNNREEIRLGHALKRH